jgi:hypothetical protein
MPVARKYSRQATTAALPGARLTAGETPGSLGRPPSATTEAIGRLGETVAGVGIHAYTQMAADERKRAYDVAMLDASNKLDAWELDKLHDTDHGALNLRGKASFELPEQVDEDFLKVSTDIEKGLSTPEQKIAFAKMRADRRMNVAMTVRRHVAGEMRTYEAETVKATVEHASSLAITNALDPKRVGEELQKGVDAIRTSGPRLGVTGEALDQQVRDFSSGVHVGVIENLLANHETKKANIYFEEQKAKGTINGDKLDEVTKMVRAGTVKGEAQTETAKILAAGGTLAEQRARAKTIEDADVQDEVLSRIEHESVVKDKIEQDDKETMMRNVYGIVDKAKSIDQIPPNVWAKIDGPQRSALREYATRLAKGEPVTTDQPTYYSLMQQAMDDPAAFSRVNLLGSRHKLSDTDFQEIARMQVSFRNGERSAATEHLLDGFRSRKEIVDNSLVQYGLDPNAKPDTDQGKANAELRRLVDRRIDLKQMPDETGKKREVSNTEMQQIVDGILSQDEQVPGSWRALYNPWGYDYLNKQKRLIDYTISDVPAKDRQAIEDGLRRRSLPVSDTVILNTFIDRQISAREPQPRQPKPFRAALVPSH